MMVRSQEGRDPAVGHTWKVRSNATTPDLSALYKPILCSNLEFEVVIFLISLMVVAPRLLFLRSITTLI